MKKRSLVLAFTLFSFVASYAQDVMGNYERIKDFMSNPTLLLLKSDGQFELVTGATSIVGTYTFTAGQITFKDDHGNYADISAGVGDYAVTATINGIHLAVVKDKAIQRKDVLIGSDWKKVGNVMSN